MNRLKCMVESRVCFSLILQLLCFSAFLPGSAEAKDERPFVLFEGTASPDGRYALAWGIPYQMLDVSDMEKLISGLNPEALENFIIDLKSGEPVATTGTGHFPNANHGSIVALWRDDSKAVVVVEGGKWQFNTASVIYIVAPDKEYGSASDPIPLSTSLRRSIKAKLAQEYPNEKEVIEQFAISVHPKAWVDAESVVFEVIGQVPKSLDAFLYEGEMTMKLAGPETVTIGGGAAPPSAAVGAGFEIKANSAGPVKLGMTIGEARAAMPTATFKRSSDGEGIALVEISENGQTLMELYANEEDPESNVNNEAVINFIQVWSPDFMTEGGVHVGMTVNHAEKSGLGDLKEIIMSELESREYATFTKQPSGLTFRVLHDQGAAGMYRNGEMTTTRALPGATIFRIEVTGADIMQDGSIGGIKIDAPEAEVLAIAEENVLGELLKGKDEIWEAFGQAVQKWLYPDGGLEVYMLSDEIGGPKSVFSITIKAPSKLRTEKGIQIGDDKAKVIQAYGDYRAEEEMDGFFDGKDVHLVGSIYGGMIFTFEDGKVSEVFLGAAAE